MNEWIWMKELMNGKWMNYRKMNKLMNKFMNERMDEWWNNEWIMNERMNGWRNDKLMNELT